MVLLRSIFQMGIPVSGKNLFPSNIAGCPLVHHSVNKDGWIARREEIEVLIAMNSETATERRYGFASGNRCDLRRAA